MNQKIVSCPECGGEWKHVALHWFHNPDHRPELTDEQKEIATGILMGDAWLEYQGENPCLKIAVIEKDYIDYLNEKFGILSTGVRLKQTADEAAAQMDENFTTTVNEGNFHDVHSVAIRSHPWFHNLLWYETGQKVYPETLELTPTTFKHWYVCDGSYHKDDEYMVISMSNEIENKLKIEKIFEESPIPLPDAWDKHNIRWWQDTSKDIFDIIGEPIDGYEYKWPQ